MHYLYSDEPEKTGTWRGGQTFACHHSHFYIHMGEKANAKDPDENSEKKEEGQKKLATHCNAVLYVQACDGG